MNRILGLSKFEYYFKNHVVIKKLVLYDTTFYKE